MDCPGGPVDLSESTDLTLAWAAGAGSGTITLAWDPSGVDGPGWYGTLPGCPGCDATAVEVLCSEGSNLSLSLMNPTNGNCFLPCTAATSVTLSPPLIVWSGFNSPGAPCGNSPQYYCTFICDNDLASFDQLTLSQ